MDFEGAKKYTLERLRNELNDKLHYHSVEHTLDVLDSVTRLAKLENVNGHDQILLKTAALFHDLGFVETRIIDMLFPEMIAVIESYLIGSCWIKPKNEIL